MALIANSTYAYTDLNDVQVFVNTTDLIDSGVWSSVATYSFRNVVLYAGALYACLTANTNTPPSGNVSDEWSTLAVIRQGVTPSGDFIENGTRVIFSYHVAWGTNTGNNEISALSVPYSNNSYATVAAALDALLYVPLAITSFTNNTGNVEIGSTVNGVVLTWAYNKAVTSQSINQGIGSLPVGDRTASDPTVLTSSRTWALSASDGTTPVNGNTSVTFLNKRYWGVSALTSLSDAQIIALNSELAATRVQSRTFAPSGNYIYFAWPTSFGTPTFTVNGLLNTAWTLVTRAFVNGSGHSSSYDIYRSNNLLTGTFVVAVS
jgi:hypothetical protein